MATSVNTNVQAMVALQNLNSTTSKLAMTQDRISTGLKVKDAKDNAAIYGIAQKQRGDLRGFEAVNQSLNRGKSILDVSLAAADIVSNLLIDLKEKAIAATDRSLDSASRAALNEDFKALRDQITKVISNAEFDGATLVGSGATNYYALANPDNTSLLTARSENLSLGSSIIVLDATASLGTYTMSDNFLSSVNSSITNLNASLSRLGAAHKAYELHSTFVSKMQDSIEAGIGNLVDADLSKESARLQALQVQQQLGAQALSIANQAPQIILNLFQ